MALSGVPKLNMSVPLAMTSAIPADYNSYFSSLEDAQAAAAAAGPPGSSSTIYYYSQVLHVLTETSADLYIIQPDKSLKYLGADTSADRNFVFTQNVASAKWEVQHDLDCWPAVTVVDSAGTEVVGDVQYIDKNKVVISFTAPFSGKAFFN